MTKKITKNLNTDKHSPNDKRSIVKNENNIAYEKDKINRTKQKEKLEK
jgi:hypothetical protein